MVNDKTIKDIRSAGAWFVGEYMELIYDNYNLLSESKEFKRSFVEKVHTLSKRDSHIRGTRTRINAVIRIIRRKDITRALQYVLESNRVKDQDPQAIEKAKKALYKIR